MPRTVSDHVLERRRDGRGERVVGHPGGSRLRGARERRGSRPEFAPTRRGVAAFGTVGYATSSGRASMPTVTIRPGAMHLLNGLSDARPGRVPAGAIVGRTDRTATGGSFQQEVDPAALREDAAGDVRETVTVPGPPPNVPGRVDRPARARHTLTAPVSHGVKAKAQGTPPGGEDR